MGAVNPKGFKVNDTFQHSDTIELTSKELQTAKQEAYNQALDAVIRSMEVLVDYWKQDTTPERCAMMQEFFNLLQYQIIHHLYNVYE